MSTLTMTDSSIAADVAAELLFDPEVTADDIRATVEHGKVTLTGVADTYATKWAAENAAFRESGVRSVHNLITVDPKLLGLPSDVDIAASVRSALTWDASIPAGRLSVFVLDGAVTLSGTVDWYYQRVAAEKAARGAQGVRSVHSQISLMPAPASATEISRDIEGALLRNAQVDAQHIAVKVSGNQVTLTGKARAWNERTEAVSAAWRAKGVADVVDQITIGA